MTDGKTATTAGLRPRGRFITLEGGEGAGKSTQARLLTEALRARGLDVVQTREPGGSQGAEDIRALLVTGEPGRWDPMTEALLHYAARRDHVRRVIAPALKAGRWVICDRFADSTMAYQGYGHRMGRESIRRLDTLVLNRFRPDLTLILDLPVEEGLARAGRRAEAPGDAGEDRYERMDDGFHARMRAGFHTIADREPERCALISAAEDVEAVHAAVLAVVANRLPLPELKREAE
ncbi:dTMP kinase [Caenispirillum salinarum]|uniref:dTMP kinase n=1 Tax=Caenispirillum salinarum TaxID=859058 RepID=UPI00384D5065